MTNVTVAMVEVIQAFPGQLPPLPMNQRGYFTLSEGSDWS